MKSIIQSLKALIKYPVLIILLLLIGYGQLFAHVYHSSAVYSFVKSSKESTYYIKSLAIKSVETEDLYIEEKEQDDERFAFKKHVEDHIHVYEFFFHSMKNSLSNGKQFSYHSSFQSPYLVFCVFRI